VKIQEKRYFATKVTGRWGKKRNYGKKRSANQRKEGGKRVKTDKGRGREQDGKNKDFLEGTTTQRKGEKAKISQKKLSNEEKRKDDLSGKGGRWNRRASSGYCKEKT